MDLFSPLSREVIMLLESPTSYNAFLMHVDGKEKPESK
jgi:hypothetical protein